MIKLINRLASCVRSVNKIYFHKTVTCWIVLSLLHTHLLAVCGDSPPQPQGEKHGQEKQINPEAGGGSVEDHEVPEKENVLTDGTSDQQLAGPPPPKAQFTPLELYHKLFQQKRQTQIEAVKSIMNIGGYEKQYKMMTLLLGKMVSILIESKATLITLGFTPGDPFPESEQTREVLSRVAENTAFFGDLLLRLPDITHSLLKKNKEWDLTFKWAIGYCNDTKIMGDAEKTLLNLAGQELELIPKDPKYRNPHKLNQEKQNKKIKDELQSLLNEHTGKKAKADKKKKREKLKKGPRLSNIQHSEL